MDIYWADRISAIGICKAGDNGVYGGTGGSKKPGSVPGRMPDKGYGVSGNNNNPDRSRKSQHSDNMLRNHVCHIICGKPGHKAFCCYRDMWYSWVCTVYIICWIQG